MIKIVHDFPEGGKIKMKKLISISLAAALAVTSFTFDNVTVLSAGDTVTWQMSANGSYWQDKGTLTTTEWDDDTELYIDVDQATTYQTLDDDVWGGCFNERGWARMEILTDGQRDEILHALFDPEAGLKLTMARTPIGSSDYAMDMYSLDDVENDYSLENFSIERDQERLIPYIKSALEIVPDLKIWASPWSPPYWMKVGGSINKKNGGSIEYTEENMDAYARYFMKYIEAYEAEGIDISMVAPQNEPTMNTSYSSCLWTGDQLRDFIKDYLGPAMQEKGVDIYLGTFTDSQDTLMDPALNDPEALQYINGVGFQWWSYQKARSLYNSNLGLNMMQTETMCGDGNNTWQYAKDQFDLMWLYFESGVTAYTMWNMVLEPGGVNTTGGWNQNAPITVNQTTGEISYNPHYYEFKHFSYYIEPNASRIATTGNYDAAYPIVDGTSDSSYRADLHEIAFQNPNGDNVLLVKNGSSSDQTVAINFNGRKIKPTLPANSISTFVIKGQKVSNKDMTDFTKSKDIFQIYNAQSGLALSVDGDSVNNEKKIIQWTDKGEANQSWYFKGGSDGCVKLFNVKSLKLVGILGGSDADNAGAVQWIDSGSTDQQWEIEVINKENGMFYKFKNKNSGKYLTMPDGNMSGGTQAVQLPATDDDSQLWRIEPKYQYSDLIFEMNFDNEDTFASVGTAQLNGSISYAKGVKGKAAVFNGSASYIELFDDEGAGLLKWLDEYTVSFWLKTDSNDTSYWLYSAPNADTQTNSSKKYVALSGNASNLVYERYNSSNISSTNQLEVSSGYPGSKWNHVVVVHNSNSSTIYINGQEAATLDNAVQLSAMLGLLDPVTYIGKANVGSGQYASGTFDEYKIYSRALAADEISKLTNEVDLSADMTEAVKVLEEAGKLDASAYTSESWAKVKAAMEQLNKVDKNDQEAVDACVKALKDAINGLVLAVIPPDTKTVPVKGSVHQKGKLVYKVSKSHATNGTVSVVKPIKKTNKKITIPKTVKLNGYVFKVTAINKKAFKNNNKLTEVIIGDNVTVINASAFEKCKMLRSVKIGKGLKSIGSKAFYKDAKLSKVVIKSTNVKNVGKSVFKGIYKNAVIDVPNKKQILKKYKKLFKKGGLAETARVK